MDIELGRGFVAFPRGLTDWEWYTEPNTARLYFHLLLTANWSRKQWQGITIQPGQLVTSRAHLARQLGLSEHQIRTALEHLVSTNDIAIKAGPKYSLVTINHYLELTGLDQNMASRRPTDGQLTATTLPSIPSQPEIPSTSSAGTTPTTDTRCVQKEEPENDGQTAMAHAAVFAEYEANIGHLPPRCRAELADYAQRLGDEVTAAVVHKCGDLGGRSWAYVRKALEDAAHLGCRTAEEYRQRSPIGGSRSAGRPRVERAEPPGDNWLTANALNRKRMKKAAV